MSIEHPLTFSVDYPERKLNQTTTLFRLFITIPFLILLGTVSAMNTTSNSSRNSFTLSVAGGLLFLGPLLMILFRQKYPRWWFNWNLELLRYMSRVGVYLALMDDRYPSTDEEQSVHLNITYPDVKKDLNRWLPLIKWLLIIPHYFVLVILNIAATLATILAWFAILSNGQYPKSLFDFVEGVMRWNLRVVSYAFILVTDQYPPFRLSE